ncbi:MAG: DUF4468 domain-containing protein [Flavobacteriaceae bacterium]|nr:DUF4468 domain-containing protein [Flavobacteriaceae bacterium]
MKKIILIALLASTVTFGQVPKLELTPNGIEPIIINVDMKQASTIYNKTIEWLENSYEAPDDIIFENIENKKLGIKDVEKTVWIANRIGVDVNYDMEYTLKIEFKNDRIRIKYTLGNFLKDGKKLTTTYKDLFKKIDGSVRYNYDNAVTGIEEKLNAKTQSLNDFIMGINNGEDW